ncbi:MAG: MBOAT family protein [Oscillospiraceae bacterium]|nr:MBOAT family protein [Oscillospiraceae bacterium]
MLFSSIPFLYYFLPVTVLLYWAVPKRAKNASLLLCSLFFYGWGEPKYLLLMALTILWGYLSGLLLERKPTKWAMLLSAAAPIAALLYFKYTDFFLGMFSLPLQHIALPIGISFYTFQILSYLADVYRKDAKAQKNFINFAAYVSLFPQLVAGPIVRYQTIADELDSRSVSQEDVIYGIQRFLIGLGKKVLIANVLGELTAAYRAAVEPSVLFAWLYAVAYAMQIYFDFSGYSDMAIGLGRVFGFHFLENFNYPFLSASATEFWRRWHMSLGTWFRDYVYIPLGGSRCSRIKWLRNILVVWALTGFWHGAAWNFILWGLLFAALLLMEKYVKLPKGISHVYLLLVVIFSFVLFGASDLRQFGADFAALLGLRGLPAASTESLYYLRSFAVPLLVGILGSTPLPKQLAGKLENKLPVPAWNILRTTALLILLVLCTAYLADGSFNPFLYFRF